jgi:transposase
LRITRVLATLDLPLVKAIAPARLSRPSSVSPALEAARHGAITCALTAALSRARRLMKSTSATWSMTGWCRHHHDGGDAAGSGRLARCLQRLAMFLAWLARKHLHVDQARAQHVALAVDHLRMLGCVAPQVAAEIGDLAVPYQQAARFVLARGGIDQPCIEEGRRRLFRR